MKPNLWPILGLCVAAVLSVPPDQLSAQDKSPASSGRAGSKVPPAEPAYALEIADGHFTHRGKQQEATLANVVDALRDMFPENNIAMVPELARVRVADLKLRADGPVESHGVLVWRPRALEETLAALRVATGNRFVWRNGWAPGPVDPGTGLPPAAAPAPVDPATGLPVASAAKEASSLYSLYLDPGAPQSRRMVEVFNLHGYLQSPGSPNANNEEKSRQSLREIEEIVLATLDRLNQGQTTPEQRPEFQFHPGASLLIVIGPPEAIEVTSKVVTALPYYGGPGTGFPATQPMAPGMNPYVNPATGLPVPATPGAPVPPR